MLLSDSVSSIKNVGAQRTQRLNALGIFTVEDLLEHFPRDYMDRSVTTPIAKAAELEPGEASIRAVVEASENLRYRETVVTKARVSDGTGVMELVWFNQPYLKNMFKPNTEFIFTGKVSEKMGRLTMEPSDYEAVSGKELLSSMRIVPVYHATDKLSQKMLRGLVKEALVCAEQLLEFMPEEVLRRYGLCGRSYAVVNLHFPESADAYFAARRRLVFEELFLTQLFLLKIKGRTREAGGLVFANLNDAPVLAKLSFGLTAAQARVLEEIKNDFAGGFVMNRLVQGDVGSGKTAVAMAACGIAIQNGFQCALMVPTETLARQHYAAFLEIFGDGAALLVGSLKKSEKDAVKSRLADGSVQIVIGTHALIQDSVAFKNLGLVITDEQHRFGVRQRAALTNKGVSPHTLVMTATPIPRTLALILYGDLDISIINELPPGRQKIDTSAVNSSYRARIYAFIKKQAAEGRQAYAICPTIEESETLSMAAVTKYAESVAEHGLKVGMLHGRLKAEEKDRVMREFANGETDILVSTTVIEVGINVPNATVMLIENSERFGLSQLHQLRGRVGRGRHKSYCILVSDAKNDVAKQRMAAMVRTNDGFEISELDLKLRGPGEFFGTRQHGLPEMMLANLYKDIDVLQAAQEAALGIFQSGGGGAALSQRLEKKMGAAGKVCL